MIGAKVVTPDNAFDGYLSSLRVVKGQALYTTTFTPSTAPLTTTSQGAIASNVSLLAFQSNRFIDLTNNFTLTPSNSPSISQNSPFVEYDTTSGSGYFDGSGDYLEGNNLSSFNFLHSPSALFTIQCWVYIPSVISSGARTIVATAPNSGGVGTTWTLEYYNSAVYMNLFIARGVGGVWVISGYSTSAFTTYNQWTHLAVTYDQSLASNNATFYINGQPAGTASKLANAPSSSNASYPLYIGRIPTNSTLDFNGYIADLQISNSILTITVPTIPQKSTSSTQLLTLQTRAPANNQGILDSSPNSFVVTRTGNVAQGSFSPFSAGGWSNYFN
ncbi:MAG: LamG domain-containing protein, partial [Betaproteobacteria bacterium]|nr:LamG domain-containing protein [Betaproteobacteria bacterium]